MVRSPTRCPICQEGEAGFCYVSDAIARGEDGNYYECRRCGVFYVEHGVSLDNDELRKVDRAYLSHNARTISDNDRSFKVDASAISEIEKKAKLPSFTEQRSKLIEMIGDAQLKVGHAAPLPIYATTARIGALTDKSAGHLIEYLEKQHLIVDNGRYPYNDPVLGKETNEVAYELLPAGWEMYEETKRGRISGNYGFIAMKFNIPELEALVSDYLKPIVLAHTGYAVTDIRDTSRAGIIDNLLRERIRDAAFVIVDLTHDNSGAYWEAGYAEGLGKPVIYICEKTKFDAKSTHFDTNHCTTVIWEVGQEAHFAEQLSATIRRSLDLF